MDENQHQRLLQLRVGHRRLQLGMIEVTAAFHHRIRPAKLQLSKSDFFWRGAGAGEGEGSHCSWKKLLEFKFGLKRCVNPLPPREERGELVGPGRTERMGSR